MLSAQIDIKGYLQILCVISAFNYIVSQERKMVSLFCRNMELKISTISIHDVKYHLER